MDVFIIFLTLLAPPARAAEVPPDSVEIAGENADIILPAVTGPVLWTTVSEAGFVAKVRVLARLEKPQASFTCPSLRLRAKWDEKLESTRKVAFEVPLETEQTETRVSCFIVAADGSTRAAPLTISWKGLEQARTSWTEAREFATRSRWQASAGLQATGILYSESAPRSISRNETALTLKIFSTYALTPRWGLRLTAFGNLFGVTLGTGDAFRVIGASLSVQRDFPTRTTGRIFFAALGPYYWTMLVPGSSFGLSRVLGAAATGGILLGGGKQVYLKYSPLFESFTTFSFGNLEVGAGGALRLSRPGARVPVSLIADGSYLRFTTSNKRLALSMPTLSLGVSIGL